jgi:redox-sensitive bicupin YhaK (pirin superfamily)
MTPRLPHRILDALPRMGGTLTRLVGSTDAHGGGTDFAIPDLGPFILIEDARGIVGPDQPPFGEHPHAGLVVASYVAEGGPWRSRANAEGYEDVSFGAGDVVITCAGRGIRHDERTVGAGDHAMTQIILRLPAARRDVRASVVKHSPVTIAEGVRRLFDRDSFGDLGLDAAFHHVTLESNRSARLSVDPAHAVGFVYARTGSVRLGDATLEQGQMAVLTAEGEVLELAAAHDAGADALVGTGAPLDEPWAKLLGHEGFVVGADADAVEALMDRYADDPEGFGRG